MTPDLKIVECTEWLAFIERELNAGTIDTFPLSREELRKLVDGWKAMGAVDIARLVATLQAVKEALK